MKTSSSQSWRIASSTLGIVLALTTVGTCAQGDSGPQPPPPALPNFHADPHIAVFGNTFYIYPTTDVLNWESPSFECWSSQDLIQWKSEGINSMT